VLRFFDLANAITLTGLVAALACALLATGGRPELAMAALAGAGLCDLFDGPVARRLPRTDEQRRFGGQLDSLVDACAFGLAPAVMLYATGLDHLAEAAVLALFVACAVWRLAFFNTVDLGRGGRTLTGLPTAYMAWVLPLVGLTGYIGFAVYRTSIIATLLVSSAAMISTLPVPKPRGVWYGVLAGSALCLAAAYLGLGRRFPVP
jgi:CDP-diacylglycerol---serine O-phosphatidyltransferase